MSKAILAKDIMAKKVVTFNPKDCLGDVIDLLVKHNISGAPVIDENKVVVGVLSEYDCIDALVQISMG